MDLLQRAPAQFLAFWRALTPRRRAMAIVFAVLTAGAIGTFAYFSTNGEYRALFANLTSDEVAAVTAKLQAQGVPFRVDATGTTVLVPEDRLVSCRVTLAAEGIPSRGGKGFELFDDTPLGMTPFIQNVNYTRALQAELARSIMQIEQVAAARVIIARTDNTPFVRNQRPSSASVVLKLKPGATLQRSTAAGIVALVARSVDGLRPDNVTLVDSSGRVLSDARPGEPDAALGGQIECRRELETYLAGKAEEMLARHLGPGRAVVRITADMNFQQVKERKESYSPDEKVVASERTIISKSTAGAPGARGVAGTGSNTGRPAGSSGSGSSSGTSQEESSQTEYLVSKSIRELEDRVGGVQRLTIAAMVDLSATSDEAAARPNLSLADTQEIIKQAVGFRKGRDEIKVTDVRLSGAFPLTDVVEDAAQLQKVTLYISLARNLALGIAFLTALATLWMLFRHRRGGRERQAPATDGPASNNGPPNGYLPHVGTNGATTNGVQSREAQRRKELGRLTEMAERDPDQLADLLETLLGGAARV